MCIWSAKLNGTILSRSLFRRNKITLLHVSSRAIVHSKCNCVYPRSFNAFLKQNHRAFTAVLLTEEANGFLGEKERGGERGRERGKERERDAEDISKKFMSWNTIVL